jgi:hypothetical protein
MKHIGKLIIGIGAALAILLSGGPARALEEKATLFDQTLRVDPDGRFSVQEKIEFFGGGKLIPKTFSRYIPDRNAEGFPVSVRVMGCVLDDNPVPYSVKRLSRGWRVDVPGGKYGMGGFHSLLLAYAVEGGVVHGENQDEIRWPVTGNDWNISIEKTVFRIVLPMGVSPLGWYASAGKARGAARSVPVERDGTVRLNRRLSGGEGLSVAYVLPKGTIRKGGRLALLFRTSLLWPLAGTAMAMAWLILAWLILGREPRPEGNPYPRPVPPGETEDAVLARYAAVLRVDATGLAALLAGLCSKGVMILHRRASRVSAGRPEDPGLSAGSNAGQETAGAMALELDPSGDLSQLSRAEQILYEHIRSGPVVRQRILHLDRAGLRWLRGARKPLYVHCRTKLNLLRRNTWAWLLGLLPWGLGTWYGFAAAGLLSPEKINAARLLCCAWGALLILEEISLRWDHPKRYATIFALPALCVGFPAGFYIWAGLTNQVPVVGNSPVFLPPILAASAATVGFSAIMAFRGAMTVRSPQGRELLEDLRAYAMALAHWPRGLSNPPRCTAEFFEKALPWSIALGISEEWSSRASAELPESYSPRWNGPTNGNPAAGESAALFRRVAAMIAAAGFTGGIRKK